MARPAPPETEPNDTKAQANTYTTPFCGSPVFLGNTTGTTGAGATSPDYFLVTLTGTAGQIVEHTLRLTSTTPGHTFTIRGLTQTGGLINAGTDAILQTAITSGTDRVCRLYTMGAAAQVYLAVTGTLATTAFYIIDEPSCTPVVPTVIPGVLRSGPITVRPTVTADAAADTDFWVYDSSLNALPDFGHDDADAVGATRSLSPGIYYIAFGNFNTTNNLASPTDDTFRTGPVLDFPNVLINDSTLLFTDMGVQVSDGFGTTLTGVGAKTAPFQVVWYQFTVGITPEVEANESKATATAATLGCGDRLTGTTTGTSTTVAGDASADYFLITTPAAEPGIYLNTLTLSSAIAGHTGTLRGLLQLAGVPTAGTDNSFQTSAVVAAARVNRFYTFGPSTQMYYRVTGTATTTSPYSTTMTCDPVSPTTIGTSFQAGPITIGRGPANNNDTDWWVYDASLNPLPDFGHDEPNATTITRTLAPGVYYVAIGGWNTANNLGSPVDDSDRNSNVLDFPGALAGSSASTAGNLDIQISDATGTSAIGTGTRSVAYEVIFYKFTVSTLPEIEPNDTKALATPAAMQCGFSMSGTTTGTSTTVAGPASADNFLITTPPAAPGIYEHVVTLTSAIPGHSATLRGLSQAVGVPVAGTDATVQTSNVIGTDRVNMFYSFGDAGQVYYRVTGTATTTAPFQATLSCTSVTPIPVSTPVRAGPITVRPTAASAAAADTDFWVYDSAFNPLPDFGHDDDDATGATRSLAPGTYYIAFGNFNTANNLGSPADDVFRSGAVMDLPGVIANSSTTTISNMSVEVADIFGTVATGVGAKTAPFQIVWFEFTVWSAAEIEANDTKTAAQPVYPACGVAISGLTTGSDSLGGSTSADTFLFTTPPATPGIYLHTLTLASTTAGHTATLRGLTQTNGVPNLGTDAGPQTSTIVGTDRVNKFYSFGTGGQMYYRVTGTAATTAPYTTTLTCTPVSPIVISPALASGPITIREVAGSTADIDYWVYDSSLNPLVDFGHDQPDTPGISRVLGPGTYYIAYGNFNTANNLGSPADDTFRTGNVTDFTGVILNGSATTFPNMNVEVVDGAGTVATGVGAKSNAFEIVWYRFTVVSTGACCCGSTCSLDVSSACSGQNKMFMGAGTVCNVSGNNLTPCCRANFNHQGGISVQDIFDFLAAFFTPDPCADFNGGTLGPQDLFDFLATYFAGGCT